MFRPRRVSRLVAAALVLFVALAGALLGMSGSASRAGGHPVTTSSSSSASGGTAGTNAAVPAGSGHPVQARTLAATASSGGPCSVPGIGDIGGLLGFCTLGQSGLIGGINNLCQPGVPQPESATSGVDALIRPPATTTKPIATPYNQYGMAGLFWAPTDLQCSDMTSLIGNDVAGMLFDFAKALDRVTITVYQSAAGEGILSWLQNVADRLISGIGNAIYFPYVALVVIIAAIWLAWQGLIRKRGTRTIEGTIWMVLACAAAIWLIGRPADFTGLGKGVSDGIAATLNTAFANLPSPGQASCLPVTGHDPQISKASFSYTSSRTVVDQNANELWTVLVCKPWLDGEFGTTAFSAGGKATPVSTFARQLLWAQAIAVNEKPTTTLVNAKQAAYQGIATTIKNKDPAVYPLFQGKEWTTRLEIGFAALLAALVAGVLVLLISVTLILLKLGFLLLLIVGPFFLLIGTHPGFGRVVAVRWFEMLVGVLLKQAAVALALSVLLYCYALIMGTSDAVLPWALKILMITLVTVAVFIYRKPFQHLFTAVGYGAIGSSEAAGASLSRAASTARDNTRTAATLGVPGFAAYRAARWARRNPAQAAGLALAAASAGTAAGAAAAGAGAEAGEYPGAVPAGVGAGGSPDPAANGVQAGATSRAKAWEASAGGASASDAPPLRLPAAQGGQAKWPANGAGSSAGAAGSRVRTPAGQAGAAGTGAGAGTGPPPLPPVVRSASQAAADRSAASHPAPGPASSAAASGSGQRAVARASGAAGPTSGGGSVPPPPIARTAAAARNGRESGSSAGPGSTGASGAARPASQAPRLAGTPIPPSWNARGQAPRRPVAPSSSGTGWPGSASGAAPRRDPAPPARQAAARSAPEPRPASSARPVSSARPAPAPRPAGAEPARPATPPRAGRPRPWSRSDQGSGATGGSGGGSGRTSSQGQSGRAPDRGRGGSGKSGSAGGQRSGSSGAGSGKDAGGRFSATPYGLRRDEPGNESSGPFWSRPIWRRK